MSTGPLKLPKQLLAEMITHALDKDPEECCGLLLGRGNTATRLRRIRNTHESRTNRYNMDPLDVIEAERDADGRGEEFVAIYHSHTYSQGYPSDTDVRNAVESGWIDPFYVLVSLVETTRPVVRAYRISADGEVGERFIRVLGAGGYTSGTTPPGLVE
ncbi:MAG: M67 family metallopeptidase [Dehalococcoidia bacterium]|jgi:proteasome lid subunit RPN8/RPN11|nr:M67 family metallopeptidase [Dehalococcoidia bacterium]